METTPLPGHWPTRSPLQKRVHTLTAWSAPLHACFTAVAYRWYTHGRRIRGVLFYGAQGYILRTAIKSNRTATQRLTRQRIAHLRSRLATPQPTGRELLGALEPECYQEINQDLGIAGYQMLRVGPLVPPVAVVWLRGALRNGSPMTDELSLELKKAVEQRFKALPNSPIITRDLRSARCYRALFGSIASIALYRLIRRKRC